MSVQKEPNDTGESRRHRWARRHPRLYAARHVVVATAEVVAGACCWRGSSSASSLDWSWLPDWHLPRLPRPICPTSVAGPRPAGLVGAGLARGAAGKQEVLVPDPRRDRVAVAEVRRRRRRDADVDEGIAGKKENAAWPGPSTPRSTPPDGSRSSTPDSPASPPTATRGRPRALICREAGIGSGTFFHYFPTKADLLGRHRRVGHRRDRGSGSPRGAAARTPGRGAARVRRPRRRRVGRPPGARLRARRRRRDEASHGSRRRSPPTSGPCAGGCCRGCGRPRPPARYGADLSAPRLTDWLMLPAGTASSAGLAGGDAFTAKRETGTLLDAAERLMAPD